MHPIALLNAMSRARATALIVFRRDALQHELVVRLLPNAYREFHNIVALVPAEQLKQVFPQFEGRDGDVPVVIRGNMVCYMAFGYKAYIGKKTTPPRRA